MKKLITSALLLIAFSAPAVGQAPAPAKLCAGTTKAAKPCQRKAQEGKQFCFQHNPETNRCGEITKSGQPCKIPVKVAGAHCFHHQKKA